MQYPSGGSRQAAALAHRAQPLTATAASPESLVTSLSPAMSAALETHTPVMQQYLRLKAQHPGRAAVLSHGRLLRAVLRRREARRAPARHHADGARSVGGPADPDGRRAVSQRRELSREAGAPRRIGGDLRADRRSGEIQGSGRAAGRARRHAGHGHRRGVPRRASRHAARRAVSRGRALRPRVARAVERPLQRARGRAARRRSRARSSGCGRPNCSCPSRSSSPRRHDLRARASALALRSGDRDARCLCEQFATRDLSGFGCAERPLAVRAAGCLLQYVRDTQKAALPHLRGLRTEERTRRRAARCSDAPQSRARYESGGSARLHASPPCSITPRPRWAGASCAAGCIGRCAIAAPIELRLQAIGALIDQARCTTPLHELLAHVGDIERGLARVALKSARPRDLAQLRDALGTPAGAAALARRRRLAAAARARVAGRHPPRHSRAAHARDRRVAAADPARRRRDRARLRRRARRAQAHQRAQRSVPDRPGSARARAQRHRESAARLQPRAGLLHRDQSQPRRQACRRTITVARR